MKDGEDGILVSIVDTAGLIEQICRVVDSRGLHAKLSETERYVRTALQKDTICRKWENLLKAIE